MYLNYYYTLRFASTLLRTRLKWQKVQKNCQQKIFTTATVQIEVAYLL